MVNEVDEPGLRPGCRCSARTDPTLKLTPSSSPEKRFTGSLHIPFDDPKQNHVLSTLDELGGHQCLTRPGTSSADPMSNRISKGTKTWPLLRCCLRQRSGGQACAALTAKMSFAENHLITSFAVLDSA